MPVFARSTNTDTDAFRFRYQTAGPEADRHVFYDPRPGWTDQVWPRDIVVAGRW